VRLRGRAVAPDVLALYSLFVIYVASEALFNTSRLLRPYPIFIGMFLVVLHSLKNRGARYTLVFFCATFTAGLLSELAGTAFGWIYGMYYYAPRPPLMVAGLVPIQTPLSWSVILYTCDALTDIIFPESFRVFCARTGRFVYSCILGLGAALFNGLEATGLDMIMDPISAGHSWYWTTQGQYFGIPLSNFLGWFMVAFVSTATARTIGVWLPQKQGNQRTFESAPILLFAMYLAEFSFAALFGGAVLGEGRPFSPELVLVGVATMVPYVAVAILALLSKRIYKNPPGTFGSNAFNSIAPARIVRSLLASE
jgi:uncharacterized membrane protein